MSFLLGLLAGGAVGFITAALMVAAGRDDRD